MRRLPALLPLVASLAAAAPAAAWTPDMAAGREYAAGRAGSVSFAVRTPTRAYGWHRDRPARGASVVKAMLMVAYLDRPGVRDRDLLPGDRALLDPMIRRSSNKAANQVFTAVGAAGLEAVAQAGGMRHFVAGPGGFWGGSQITAADQARFFLRIDARIPARHREYAMALLETIVPGQRWGIARVQPDGWRLFFKGGWGDGSGEVDHQVALLTAGGRRVAIAILTTDNPDHAYGTRTLREVARRLLRGLEDDGGAA